MRRHTRGFASLAAAARPDLVISGAECANPEMVFTVAPRGRTRLWCNKVIYESEKCEMVWDNGSRDLEAAMCDKLTAQQGETVRGGGDLRARKSRRYCSRHLEPTPRDEANEAASKLRGLL